MNTIVSPTDKIFSSVSPRLRLTLPILMATPLSSISPPAHTTLSSINSHKPPSPLWLPRQVLRRFAPSLQAKSPFSANSTPSSVNGASSTAVEGDVATSIDVLKCFIDLNLGSWKGSFHVIVHSSLRNSYFVAVNEFGNNCSQFIAYFLSSGKYFCFF